jgi:hypothetical protein
MAEVVPLSVARLNPRVHAGVTEGGIEPNMKMIESLVLDSKVVSERQGYS